MNPSYDAALEEIAQSVLATMLGIEAFRRDDAANLDASAVTSSIGIHGGFNGEVTLRFAPGLAEAAAAAMFRLPPQLVASDDIRDMATELANMIGGNFKSLVPAPSSLALPRIVERSAPQSDAAAAACVVLDCEAGPLTIELHCGA